MDIGPMYERVIGLDVHQAKITGCAIIEHADGCVTHDRREFGGFKRDRQALAEWVRSLNPQVVVMESTGIYWKPVFNILEEGDFDILLVNARHVRNVPGHKTDKKDSQWLSKLLLSGLLKGSFIPPVEIRELRDLVRYKRKVVAQAASEKNRIIKILEEIGIVMPIVELHTKFLRPAKYDDLLTIKTQLRELPTDHRIEFHHEVLNQDSRSLLYSIFWVDGTVCCNFQD